MNRKFGMMVMACLASIAVTTAPAYADASAVAAPDDPVAADATASASSSLPVEVEVIQTSIDLEISSVAINHQTTPVSCRVVPQGKFLGTYQEGGLRQVQGTYSVSSDCDTIMRRIQLIASLTRNGAGAGTAPSYLCYDRCKTGTSTSNYACSGFPSSCSGTYLVASFVDLKLFDGQQFTSYPKQCILAEADTRILCNPLKSGPAYMPPYK